MIGIVYVSGDILKATTEAIINPVNTAGVMGAGLAKQFHSKYPRMFKDYRDMCRLGELIPGRLHVFDREGFSPPFYIINFPTKKHWSQPSRLEYIETGLSTLVQILGRLSARSISIPKLGCGLGGLNWCDVNSLIKKYLSNAEVKIMVYGEDI